MVLDGFFNIVLGPIVNLPSPWGVLIISVGLTLFMTIIYKLMTDQEVMKSLKKETKEIQKEMKKFKDDPSKVMELQKEAMKKNMEYFKKSMKPNLVSLLPIIFLFGWLRKYFDAQQGTYFMGLSWFWVYFIFAIISSILIRKMLKVS